MKTNIASLIYASGLIACTWVAGQAWLEGKRAHEKAETTRAQYAAVSKMLDAEIAYTQLEMKRTTVQREVREMVIAEWRKCKKGKC